MTIEELPSKVRAELIQDLTEDILERYDNDEYWNKEIIERYLREAEEKEN